MAKRFLKYDKANPPAGVNADGVFTGGGSEPFVVTATNASGKYTVDKTIDEITAAYLAGRPVFLFDMDDGQRRIMMTDLYYDTASFYAPYDGGLSVYRITSNSVTKN